MDDTVPLGPLGHESLSPQSPQDSGLEVGKGHTQIVGTCPSNATHAEVKPQGVTLLNLEELECTGQVVELSISKSRRLWELRAWAMSWGSPRYAG